MAVNTSGTTNAQYANLGSSAVVAAVGAYASYDSAKHSARVDSMNWDHNREMVLENQKINDYIISKNKIDLLDASESEQMNTAIEEMRARAAAQVAQASYGIKGGSANQVLHDISRQAERMESQRLYNLDSALFANQMQLYSADSGALAQIGIRPVGGVSGALAVGQAASQFKSDLQSMMVTETG